MYKVFKSQHNELAAQRPQGTGHGAARDTGEAVDGRCPDSACRRGFAPGTPGVAGSGGRRPPDSADDFAPQAVRPETTDPAVRGQGTRGPTGRPAAARRPCFTARREGLDRDRVRRVIPRAAALRHT